MKLSTWTLKRLKPTLKIVLSPRNFGVITQLRRYFAISVRCGMLSRVCEPVSKQRTPLVDVSPDFGTYPSSLLTRRAGTHFSCFDSLGLWGSLETILDGFVSKSRNLQNGWSSLLVSQQTNLETGTLNKSTPK